MSLIMGQAFTLLPFAKWMVGASAALFLSVSAQACPMYFHPDFRDVRDAYVVVTGKIVDYKIVEPTERRGRYARFNIQVDTVVLGEAAEELDVWWSNSTFSLPEYMEDGSYIVALRQMVLLDDARHDDIELTPVQRACSSAFIYKADSEQARIIQEILSETEGLDTEP